MRPSSTPDRRRPALTTLGAACIALWLWFGGVAVARAGELVIDLRARPAGSLQHDGGEDPFASMPSPSYRATGDPNLTRVQVWPWPPTQGDTLVVSVRALAPVTFTLAFGGYQYIVHSAAGAGWSLVPIPPLMAQGYAPLTIQAGRQRFVLSVPVRARDLDVFNIPAAAAAPILSNAGKVNAEAARMGNGVFTGYWHLSALDVEPGASVAPGQLLGKVGSTGLSTGAHLHWELRIAGMAVDPLQWIR